MEELFQSGSIDQNRSSAFGQNPSALPESCNAETGFKKGHGARDGESHSFCKAPKICRRLERGVNPCLAWGSTTSVRSVCARPCPWNVRILFSMFCVDFSLEHPIFTTFLRYALQRWGTKTKLSLLIVRLPRIPFSPRATVSGPSAGRLPGPSRTLPFLLLSSPHPSAPNLRLFRNPKAPERRKHKRRAA